MKSSNQSLVPTAHSLSRLGARANGAGAVQRYRYGGRKMRALPFLAFLLLSSANAAEIWPGLSPDCWTEPRMFHNADESDSWRKNTKITFIEASKPEPGEFSPNKGYFFLVEGGRPTGKITIFSEKDHLIQIEFSDLFGLSDVKWINEKLLFMRPWWGRTAATDIIYDVEKENVIYAEYLVDGAMTYQQFRESCPVHGCSCIKKR